MDWPRAILHVDMDAFFASVEQLDAPELRGQPVLVGGRGRRSVVCAASYEARQFGCHSAQPMGQALARCPQAVVRPPRFQRYVALSQQVFEVFARYSPLVEGLSIDEAFLDISGTRRLLGPPESVARRVAADVLAATGLTCSVGLATNKFLAKLASDQQKPHGCTIVAVGSERAFLDPMPVARLWGVGRKSQARLAAFGIHHVRDLLAYGEGALRTDFGRLGTHLFALASGEDVRPVEGARVRQQISQERTFERDLRKVDDVESVLLAQATEIADRLVARDVMAGQVQIKLRRPNFETRTRQRRLRTATTDAGILYRAALELYLASGWVNEPLRLVGFGVAELDDGDDVADSASQLELPGLHVASDRNPTELIDPKRARLQQTVSSIRARYGQKGLFPARLAEGNVRADGLGNVLGKQARTDLDGDPQIEES